MCQFLPFGTVEATSVMLAGKNNGISICLLTKNALLPILLFLSFSVLCIPAAFVGQVGADLELGFVLQLPLATFYAFF